MGDPVTVGLVGIRRGVAAMLVAGALVLAPLAATTADAAPVEETETYTTSTWDNDIVIYTYGVGDADIFKGATLHLPRFDPVVGGVTRTLTGVRVDYLFRGDTGRDLANWTKQDSVVDSYKSTFDLSLSIAGEPVHVQYTWFDKEGPFLVKSNSTYDLGSLNPNEPGTYTPADLSAFVGSGDFPVRIEASMKESIVTDGKGAYAQGWEGGGVDVTVTYTFETATAVTPTAPSLSTPGCGEAATVVLPTTKGVDYSKKTDGDTVTVTATAQDGYALADGATSSWTLTIPKVVACAVPVTPAAPSVSAPDCGESATVVLPTTEGVEYSKRTDGDTVTVTATAKDGHVIAAGATANWTLTIPKVVACGAAGSEGTQLAWTGAELSGSLPSALGLIGVGATLISVARRRR
jgi:hypothetical protein